MKENNAAQAVEQDPINAAILLLTEEADSISDCHTRTLGDWAGEPEAKAHYDHVRSVVDALSQLRAPVADERALDLLDTLFTAYESGTPCYEEPDSQGGYLGMAFRIDDDTFRACADLLNKHRPRAALASAPVPVLKDWRIDTSAGGPILVYKDCSVIESAQAEYVLRLIAADQASAPVAGKTWEAVDYVRGGALNFDAHPDGAPVADERAAVDPCGYVAVKVAAVDWLKDKFPALTIKAGLCERIGGRLYTITRLMRDHDAALASAPVAGEARPVIHQHGFASDNQKLRAINESLDKQLEEVVTERDEYHDMADKLANAIADHLLVEIGEHSSSNCPWMRALDAIQNAAPQASAEDAQAPADVTQLVAFIFDRFGQPGDAGELPDNVAAAVRRLERGIKAQADKDGGQQREGVVTDDMRYAVRFAPSSAHWSERLKEFFGPDAREGIDALERQLREAIAMLDQQQRAGDELTRLRAENQRLRNGVDQDMAEVGRLQALYDSEWRKCKKLRAAFDHPVFAFLLGEGQLHGVDFGERALGAVGKWWWRKDLRAALSATQAEQGERDA